MTEAQRIQNLQVPVGPIDVVLDTDAYNEIDDQLALAYLLRSEKATVKALYAAPFFNERSTSPADGMEKSEAEIRKILTLAERDDLQSVVFSGSRTYMPDENTPVDSPAARDLARRAAEYTTAHPLYVVAIGAITNIASALRMNPDIADRIVMVWLGGHAQHWPDTMEFNMKQDVAAARVVFGCGAPLIQLPCMGCVDAFAISGAELQHWMLRKNQLCDYLVKNTTEAAEAYAKGRPWSRVIWDVTAVGWLMNDGEKLMQVRILPAPIPEYDHHYGFDPRRHSMGYVWHINRDALFRDLLHKLGAIDEK